MLKKTMFPNKKKLEQKANYNNAHSLEWCLTKKQGSF